MSMASTGEESAEQDGAPEHAVPDAVQALIDQGDDALDGVTPGDDEEDEEVDEDEETIVSPGIVVLVVMGHDVFLSGTRETATVLEIGVEVVSHKYSAMVVYPFDFFRIHVYRRFLPA